MRWKGKTFSGEGKAAEFLDIDPYSNYIEDTLGLKPYPGTLNLRGNAARLSRLKNESKAFSKQGFSHEGRSLGGITLYRCEIEDVLAAIVEPERTRYSEEVAEVVAEKCLREELSLKDGDTVFLQPLGD